MWTTTSGMFRSRTAEVRGGSAGPDRAPSRPRPASSPSAMVDERRPPARLELTVAAAGSPFAAGDDVGVRDTGSPGGAVRTIGRPVDLPDELASTDRWTGPYVIRPRRIPSATAAARSETPSLAYRLCRWVLTVAELRCSCD